MTVVRQGVAWGLAFLATLAIGWSCASRNQGKVQTVTVPQDAGAPEVAPPPADAGPFLERVALSLDHGLAGPATVLYDGLSDSYLVANVNGDRYAKDNNGFVSRVSPQGEMIQEQWIAGGQRGVTLHGPLGMALWGGFLFVADIEEIRQFDRRTGEKLGSWKVPKAARLHGVAVTLTGTVYASDEGRASKDAAKGALFRFNLAAGEAPSAIKNSPERPTALVVQDNKLVLIGGTASQILQLEESGEFTSLARLPAQGLDGLAAMAGGTFLVASRSAGAIYQVDSEGHSHVMFEGLPSTAGIGFDNVRLRILIPLADENQLLIRTLLPLPASAQVPDAANEACRNCPVDSQPALDAASD